MYFEIVGDVKRIQTVAVGGRIQDIMRIRRRYGPGQWRTLRGVARVSLQNQKICKAELHWYEAHGVGRRKIKIKRIMD